MTVANDSSGLCSILVLDRAEIRVGGGGTPYNVLYGEAPPEKDTFFRLRVYKRVGISQVEVYKNVGKLVLKRAFNCNISNAVSVNLLSPT